MKFRVYFVTLVVTFAMGACTMNRPVCATSNPLGDKIGVYSRKGILFMPPFSNTDAAIQKAAENGGISKISTVDYNVTFFLFFTEYRTVVRGE